jgi:hypothetical protein
MKTIISNVAGRKEFFKGIDTVKFGIPWLSFGAIMTLESIVDRNQVVLEYGSGGSTVFFANKCKYIKSYETDFDWYTKVKESLKDFTNVNLEFVTEDQAVVKTLTDPVSYDIVLVDSGWNPGHKSPDRLLLADTAKEKLKLGGFLILDNYMHYGLKDFNFTGYEVYTMDDIGYSGRGTKICQKIK